MRQLKRSHGGRVRNSQRRQFSATQFLRVKIAGICKAVEQIKLSPDVRISNFQNRQFSTTQILLVKIAIICFAGGVTIYYQQNVIVAAVASTIAGCTVEIIDALREQQGDRK
ncbi:MAG: hypothetical protein MUE44_27960 [Oscillatoriaceae cyanobacterium Prado104]|jgi:uncharacterized protein GlcG (DUF336 family)|nr:hypothetical protein [Oscillatoriaceae cyanobacterium Prado104]